MEDDVSRARPRKVLPSLVSSLLTNLESTLKSQINLKPFSARVLSPLTRSTSSPFATLQCASLSARFGTPPVGGAEHMPDKGGDASQRRNGRERRRRRRHLTDHLLVFGEGVPGSYHAQPAGQPRLLYAYPPGLPLPPSIATFCFPGGALPPAAQGSPIFSCNVVSSATRRVHI
jgi:hypothetical protein